MAKFMKIILTFMVFSISVMVIVVIAAKTLNLTGNMAHFNDLLHQHKIGFMIWRYFIMAVIIGFWPRFIRHINRYSQKPQEEIHKLARRRVIILIFVFYELIIVQNGIGFLIQHVF